MRAVVFDKVGLPTEVLRLAEVATPEVGDDEALVEMLASPINPGDFLFIQDLYPEPKKPHFPAQVGGNYGAGIVQKAGKNTSLHRGALVSVTHYNTWAEYAVVPEKWLIRLPAYFPIEKAAQFMNLITGWDLVQESRVQSGQLLLVTAGNSTVAIIALQFAKRMGVKVIPVVRSTREGLDLRSLGAEEVIDLSQRSEGISDVVSRLTNGAGINAVIDCVGGPLLNELIGALAPGGQVVIYGGFDARKFALHNFDLLMKGAAIRSYIYRYFFSPPPKEDEALLLGIIEASEADDFQIPLAGFYSLDEFKTAVDASVHRPAQGKRMFRMK